MTTIRKDSNLKARDNAPGVFDVQGKHGDWITIVRGSARTCTCPDYVYRRTDGSSCKHIDAALILLEAQSKAFQVVNEVKSHSSFIVSPPDGETLELHYRDGQLYLGNYPIKAFSDIEKIKERLV